MHVLKQETTTDFFIHSAWDSSMVSKSHGNINCCWSVEEARLFNALQNGKNVFPLHILESLVCCQTEFELLGSIFLGLVDIITLISM